MQYIAAITNPSQRAEVERWVARSEGTLVGFSSLQHADCLPSFLRPPVWRTCYSNPTACWRLLATPRPTATTTLAALASTWTSTSTSTATPRGATLTTTSWRRWALREKFSLSFSYWTSQCLMRQQSGVRQCSQIDLVGSPGGFLCHPARSPFGTLLECEWCCHDFFLHWENFLFL